MRKAMHLAEVLLLENMATSPRRNGTQGYAPAATAGHLVRVLLDETPICEATVHRPRRGKVWVATFTSCEGGQIWRTTGLTNRTRAMIVARRWEAQARLQRARLGRSAKKSVWRVHRPAGGNETGPLSQEQVARLLNLSVRGVRGIEHRALKKIRNHPELRQAWQRYVVGELDEAQSILATEEVDPVLKGAQASQEQWPIQKVSRMIRR